MRDGNSRLYVARKTKAAKIKVIMENDDFNSVQDFNKRVKKNGLPSQGTSKLPIPK